MIHGLITKILPNKCFIVYVKDDKFEPQVNKVISFIPDKVKVDNKRKQIFKFLRYLAHKADYELLFGDESEQFKGFYDYRLKSWKTKEHDEWFRHTLLLNAGLSEPNRVFYYIDGVRKHFDGVKPFSLTRENAGLKELTTVYEELKRHVSERGVDIDEWESQQEG